MEFFRKKTGKQNSKFILKNAKKTAGFKAG